MEIDLRDVDALHEELAALMREEDLLFQKGVKCPIKDRDDTCCSACPVRVTDPSMARAKLCSVGVDQEKVATYAAVAQLDSAA